MVTGCTGQQQAPNDLVHQGISMSPWFLVHVLLGPASPWSPSDNKFHALLSFITVTGGKIPDSSSEQPGGN